MTATDLGVTIPVMKAMLNEPEAEGLALQQGTSVYCGAADGEIDILLLADSLGKTPWERMQANDDALRFADSLRGAMERRNARPERTDTQTG